MSEEQRQKGVRASDIRTPRSRAELDTALAFVRGRVESIERDLEQRDEERFPSQKAHAEWRNRATKALVTWRSKLAELEYWSRRLDADADPERARLLSTIERLESELRELRADAALRSEVRS